MKHTEMNGIRLLSIFIFFYGFIFQSKAQIESLQTKVIQILEPQTFYLNSKTKIGGKNRVDFEISLPPNTLEWYYSFTTAESQNLNSTSNLELLSQLSKFVDETGITTAALQSIFSPTGTFVCDVYLMNAQGRQEFYQTTELGTWSNTKPSAYLEGTRENFKNGVVPILHETNGAYYLGFRNPSTTQGEWITLEVAAVVQEREILDEWSSANRQLLFNNFSKQFISQNSESDEVCRCAVEKITSQKKPSQFISLSESEQSTLYNQILDSCYAETGHIDLKNYQQYINSSVSELVADILAKDFSSCASKSIELIKLGYDAYNDAGSCLLLTKNFDSALKYLAQGSVKDPANLYIQGNLAHAYLLTDHFEDAKKIYLKNKKTKLSKDLSWKQMIDQDFNAFEQAGIQNPHFDEIRKLLKIKEKH